VIRTTGGPERALPSGLVGCVAQLRDVEMLADGRANVVVEGIERFALETFVDAPAPYHVALVTSYTDGPDDEIDALDAAAERVRTIFARLAQAAHTIADDEDPVPELSDEPTRLAFRIASMVDFDDDDRQALLASRSPLARLRQVETLLTGAVAGIERRAAAHRGASSNGHGPHAGDVA
jgi:Lon protease-like protein